MSSKVTISRANGSAAQTVLRISAGSPLGHLTKGQKVAWVKGAYPRRVARRTWSSGQRRGNGALKASKPSSRFQLRDPGVFPSEMLPLSGGSAPTSVDSLTWSNCSHHCPPTSFRNLAPAPAAAQFQLDSSDHQLEMARPCDTFRPSAWYSIGSASRDAKSASDLPGFVLTASALRSSH